MDRATLGFWEMALGRIFHGVVDTLHVMDELDIRFDKCPSLLDVIGAEFLSFRDLFEMLNDSALNAFGQKLHQSFFRAAVISWPRRFAATWKSD